MTPRNLPPVLHVDSSLRGGGTDDQCVKLVAGLHRGGFPAWVAGPDGREISKLIRRGGVPFQPTPPHGPLKLRLSAFIARRVRADGIRILHAHHGGDYWPTLIAALMSGRRPRIVLTRHMAKSPASGPGRWLLLSASDAVIAVSNFVSRVLTTGVYEPASPSVERRARPPMHGNHRKIHVIHGGIDTEYFRPREAVDPAVQALRRDWGLAPDEFAFAVVGGYDGPRGKGQREFLVAAARVHPAAPKARFLIVGRGNMEDQLRADIRRLGLEQVARLVPYCHDIASAMNALDCLVHPQVGTEAFGLVLLEGFACGKPVIASELDGIPEAFAAGQLGQLVPPENIEALAAAMLRWSHTPPLAFGERSQLHARVARDFSIARYAERVRRLYEQLA